MGKYYKEYIHLKNTSRLIQQSNNKLLLLAASLVDEGNLEGDIKIIETGIEFIEGFLLEQVNSPVHKHKCYFYLGNSYSDREELRKGKDAVYYDFKDYEKAIFYLRKALSIKKGIDKEVRNLCLINLANIYNHLGRFIEAIELYSIAINQGTNNQLAYLNRGLALFHYSFLLYDKGHQRYFLFFAFQNLEKGFDMNNISKNAIPYFQKYYNSLLEHDIDKIKESDLSLQGHSLGERKEEIEYRKWCLKNNLFLNDLNDLGNFSIAGSDVILLPDMITKISEGNPFLSLYNQLKQEFISARFFLYEGIIGVGNTHFSDKRVLLVNNLDYGRFSINIERIKSAYKILYSIFDKVAFFLNEYLELGMDQDKTNFKSIWYDKDKEIKKEIIKKNNNLLRGLFLISKDLLFHKGNSLREKEEEEIDTLKESINPSARKLNVVRNHLEHKFMNIVDDFGYSSKDNNLSLKLSESELIEDTSYLAKLVRETLITLSLGIKIEEGKKEKDINGIIAPFYTGEIPHDFKI